MIPSPARTALALACFSWFASGASAQTRCDGRDGAIFHVTEIAPQLTTSYADLEQALNDAIDLAQYEPVPDDRIIVAFVINCRGEAFDYRVARPIDPRLERRVLAILKSTATWSPGEQRGRAVDVANALVIDVAGGEVNVLDEEELARARRGSRRRAKP